jgi:hypothetical protein
MRKILVATVTLAALTGCYWHHAHAQSPGVVTITACGTAPTANPGAGAAKGTINIGSGGTFTCTITLPTGPTWPALPTCVANVTTAAGDTVPAAVALTARSSSSVTFTSPTSMVAGSILDYMCQ